MNQYLMDQVFHVGWLGCHSWNFFLLKIKQAWTRITTKHEEMMINVKCEWSLFSAMYEDENEWKSVGAVFDWNVLFIYFNVYILITSD